MYISIPNFIKISQMVFEILQFFISQDGDSYRLGFQKFSNLLADRGRRAEMHYLAKCHQHWSIHCRDIMISQFFKMVATTMLDF